MKNSDHICELLSPIEPHQAYEFIENDRYLMQRKEDGFRLVVDGYMGGLCGFDRKGQITAIPARVKAALKRLGCDFMLDGEILHEGTPDECYVVWDLLRWDEDELQSQPYGTRFRALQELGPLPAIAVGVLRSVECWSGSEDKTRRCLELHRAGAEGVCFKDTLAIYQPGRARQHFKLKFWESATCRVADKALRADQREDRHSIALELWSDARQAWQAMGFVTIPAASPLPAIGKLVEVRYLYAQADGLYQPVFCGVRTDLDAGDSLESLKWKERVR